MAGRTSWWWTVDKHKNSLAWANTGNTGNGRPVERNVERNVDRDALFDALFDATRLLVVRNMDVEFERWLALTTLPHLEDCDLDLSDVALFIRKEEGVRLKDTRLVNDRPPLLLLLRKDGARNGCRGCCLPTVASLDVANSINTRPRPRTSFMACTTEDDNVNRGDNMGRVGGVVPLVLVPLGVTRWAGVWTGRFRPLHNRDNTPWCSVVN
jgi:hypothetical protein